MRAVVYIRQSMDRTGEQLGVGRQREDCEQLCHQRGWNVVAIESDNDASASGKAKREGFDAALAGVERGDVDAIVAWDLTRLTRNRRDQIRLVETCEPREATVALVRGSDMDMGTPAGRMMADMLAAVARHEIEQKSDRQKRANLQAAKAGKRRGGRRPFGYEPDGVTIRPGEAQAVRDGYDMLLAGVPLAAIAREWNERGFRAKSAPWTHDTVRGVLTNPRYAGRRGYAPNTGKRGRRKVEDMGPAEWPAIVEHSTYTAVQAILDGSAQATRPRGAKALLTGVGLCGICDATVHGGGSTTGLRSYRCSGSWGHVQRRADHVDEYVSAVAVERLSRPDAADLLVDEQRPDVEALQSERLAVSSRLDSLATEWADGTLTDSQIRTATERLRDRLAELDAQLADAGRVNVLGPLVNAGDVESVWASLSTDRKRAVVDTLMVVRIHPAGRGARYFRPETVEIAWRQ